MLRLSIGEQKLLKITGLHRFSLGSEAVRAIPLPSGAATNYPRPEDRLLIKAIRPGLADLWIWKKDGASEHRLIEVERAEALSLAPALRRALSSLEEVEVHAYGSKATLRGTVLSAREAARISSLIQSHPKEVVDETRASIELLDEGHSLLETWLTRHQFTDRLRIERQGELLWIRGAVRSEAESLALKRQILSVFPRVEFDLNSLPDSAPTVHFKVYLLELKKSVFGSFGLNWPAVQEGAFRVTPWQVTQALQLDVALQALQGEGNVKVLSSPELVVRTPGEAQLFAGGEIPIRSRSYLTGGSEVSSQVSWRSFGLILKLKVTHSAAGWVRLEIHTEVSHLDATIGIDDIPGIQANRMTTQVDAQFGAPLLLSGLLQQGIREQAKGLPFLRRIPVLGKLFGSEDYLNDQSELVAVLLPTHAPPPPPMRQIRREQAELERELGSPRIFHSPTPLQSPEPARETTDDSTHAAPWKNAHFRHPISSTHRQRNRR